MPEHRYVDESGFAGHTVSNAAGVRARVLANGALESLSVGPIMVNLLVGSPVGGGATKLYGRTHDAQGRVAAWKDLLSGARVETKDDALVWRGVFAQHPYAVALALHPEHTAWRWTVTWDGPGDFDAVLVQDVGVASRGQSQNNEAYTSQYIDHRVLDHPEHGPGFFAPSHRTTAVPELIASTDWPHAVLQHEWSMHALCSAVRRDEGPIVFTGVFVADHPEASAAADRVSRHPKTTTPKAAKPQLKRFYLKPPRQAGRTWPRGAPARTGMLKCRAARSLAFSPT